MLASQTRTRSVTTRIALTTTQKGSMSMSDYFGKMRSLADDMAAAGHQVVAAGKCSVDKAPCGPAPRKDPKKPSFPLSIYHSTLRRLMVTECRAAEQSRGVTPMAFWSSFVNAWITPTCAGSSLLWNLCLRFDNGKTVCVNVSSYAFEIKSADIVPLNSYRHLSFKKNHTVTGSLRVYASFH